MDLGPSSRHLFTVPPSKGVNYVKLNMYPDGGIVSSVAMLQAPIIVLTVVFVQGAIPCIRLGVTRLPLGHLCGV